MQPQQPRDQIADEEGRGEQSDGRWHGSEIGHRDRADRRVVDDEKRREPKRGKDEEGGHGILGGANDGPQRARGHPEAGHFPRKRTIDRLSESMLQRHVLTQRGERAAERRRYGR